MRLRPTLLIGSVPFAPKTVEKLLAQPVAFLAINPRSLADIENDVRTLARLVNRVAAGEKLIARMRRTFDEIRGAGTKLPRQRKPRVYCEAWPNPRISSPPWVSELVALAGGRFVVPPGNASDRRRSCAREAGRHHSRVDGYWRSRQSSTHACQSCVSQHTRSEESPRDRDPRRIAEHAWAAADARRPRTLPGDSCVAPGCVSLEPRRATDSPLRRRVPEKGATEAKAVVTFLTAPTCGIALIQAMNRSLCAEERTIRWLEPRAPRYTFAGTSTPGM